MAATTPSPTARELAHCTGRFDYVLPAELVSQGAQQKLYRIEVAYEPLTSSPSDVWKHKVATTQTKAAAAGVANGPTREFELRGVGPAAWMQLFADSPNLLTLLVMKPIPSANLAVFLQAPASPGREAFAEKGITEVAASYAPSSAAGFCAGPGAFVIRPSQNERALEAFVARGISVSIETETVAAPDDGQSTDGPMPAGVTRLLKKSRNVGGFDGIEERVQIVEAGAPASLVYTWIYAGQPGSGAAPRIRLSASGIVGHAAGLDPAWDALLGSWRARPVGVR